MTITQQLQEVSPCPWCGTAVKVYVVPLGFQCLNCGRIFDGDPSEGGSHYDDPTKRIEREERQTNQPPYRGPRRDRRGLRRTRRFL